MAATWTDRDSLRLEAATLQLVRCFRARLAWRRATWAVSSRGAEPAWRHRRVTARRVARHVSHARGPSQAASFRLQLDWTAGKFAASSRFAASSPALLFALEICCVLQHRCQWP